MADNSIDELNLIRSLLRSDDDLQIRPSGDVNQISIRLEHNVSISFFQDSKTSLTINDVQDLRISKLSKKESLKCDEWINIRDYFNQLIEPSTSSMSIYTLVELLQEALSSKSNPKTLHRTVCLSKSDASTHIERFRSADLIFNRIAHDTNIDRSKVLIGYEDRFTGVQEVQFNEFKKVHDNQYGIPMHRIRYFKISGSIVWDRIKKYDILTGNNSQDNQIIDTEETSDLTEGLYHFDHSTQKWVVCPHISLATDDLKSSSIDNTYIPKKCQFLTWNILFDYYQSELIYSNQRYEQILKTLKSLLPDVICLQEVTMDFLYRLLDESWLKENNYYIIIMGCILNCAQKQPYGQIMLTKKFRPRAFSICPLHIFDDSVQKNKKNIKEYIVARFALNSKVTIDLVNLHLYSNFKYDSTDKRCQSLEYFFKTMNTQNYMLIGDFNFGDYCIKEQNLLHRYQHEIHDLWKEIYDLDENPGCTFDPSRNTCAQITSTFPQPLRLDRYLLHTLHDLSYSIEHLNMTGLETIIIDSEDHEYLNQSDHYGLQLVINFRMRSINHHSALVLLLPTIESYSQWPPHIKLLWPFFNLQDIEDDEERILLPLRLLLAQHLSFEIDCCKENCTTYMKLNQQIKQLFPQSLFDDEKDYHPYLTIDKFDKKKIQSRKFHIHYVYILRQNSDDDTAPFYITHEIPLGSVLKPIELNRYNDIGFEIQDLYEQKQEKFKRLSVCFEEIFNNNTTHYFTHEFCPYGSFRLGLHGNDLDAVLVICEQTSTADKTNLDQLLFRTRYDQLELNDHIMNLLTNQLTSNEIIECWSIAALYPIIKIVFQDQTHVDIFVQMKDKSKFHEPIHGVHDIERLITYARIPSIFQQLLTFIRIWAQRIGIYGQVYGYLGGYSWAILCAYICHKFISLTNSPVFSTEQFILLIEKFFSVFSEFDWLSESICFYPKAYHSDNCGSMQILCPSSPYNNSARSTTNSTRYLIIQCFKTVNDILKNTTIKSETILKELLHLPNQFPDKTIESILQLKLSSNTIQELNRWIDYMKSRLGHFIDDCEYQCKLFVQTDNKVEQRTENLERFYSIGFQLNEQVLSRHRQFYHCLKDFFDQFTTCSFRTDTMKLSYKLMSIHDWKQALN